MNNSTLVGLSRQVALRRELDTIANNLANMKTAGFKADTTVMQEYRMPVARMDDFRGPDRILSFVQDMGQWTDHDSGPLNTTGNPLDVAIRGEGYFAVETPDGERYTRAGTFQLNAGGELVTQDGKRILGVGGPIIIPDDAGDISIGRDGTVSDGENDLGRLRVVQFENPQLLQKQGDVLFSSPQPPQDIAADQVLIAQGVVEESNVSAIQSMARMTEVSRAYQTIAGLLQRTDDLRRDALGRLADIPS